MVSTELPETTEFAPSFCSIYQFFPKIFITYFQQTALKSQKCIFRQLENL